MISEKLWSEKVSGQTYHHRFEGRSLTESKLSDMFKEIDENKDG